jgi:hypothetical protein
MAKEGVAGDPGPVVESAGTPGSPAEGGTGGGRSGRRTTPFRSTRTVVLLLVIVLALALGGGLVKLWDRDRPDEIAWMSIKDLSRFVAAEMEGSEIIEVQRDCGWVPMPGWLCGERTVLFAVGSVEAYVDFTNLDQKAIKVSEDHHAVEITVPAPRLATPKLDHSRCRAYNLQKGLANRFSDFVDNDPNKLNELHQLADKRLVSAARSSTLIDRAKDNTRKTLQTMVHALGYSTVTVTFQAA